MKQGGRNRGSSRHPPSPPPPSSRLPAPGALGASETSLPTPSPAGTSLPTSVIESKSITVRLHLSSAGRSHTFHWLFHLPVSFCTSAHRIFCCALAMICIGRMRVMNKQKKNRILCWAFHSGHTLRRCSRFWVWYRHHQHRGVGRFFVQWRYCPVRQCLVWPRLRFAGTGDFSRR